MKKNGIYNKVIKRIIDILISGIALIILSPIILILYILVKSKLGSPVFFSQERPGKDGKIFKMYKFRSMTDAKDENGNLLPDEVRLTSFGRKLRSTSLDELPELWNIFKGDMSIIGPRPLLVQYLPRYTEEQSHRHDIRPGLTGLAQVSGRNALSWEDKFKYDIEYVNNVSLSLDIKIFFRTVKAVLTHEGISAAGEATMGEFMGTEAKE